MSERVTKTGSNRDHSELAPNEIKSDNEGFSTLIRLSPEEAEYNGSSVLATVTNEDINTSKKRKRKTKKRQNRSTSTGNEEAEMVPSPWAFPKQE